jgi:hypothetical protein
LICLGEEALFIKRRAIRFSVSGCERKVLNQALIVEMADARGAARDWEEPLRPPRVLETHSVAIKIHNTFEKNVIFKERTSSEAISMTGFTLRRRLRILSLSKRGTKSG